MKKSLLLIFSLILSLAAQAEVKLGFNGEESASVGIYIKDLNTGQVIASNDPYRSVLPASVMKAITAATAFTTLDYDFRFATEVYLTGSISGSVCSGNLLIKSCADPTIDSENFKDLLPTFKSEIAKALAAKGVKTITGKIIVSETLSDAGVISQWEVDDVAWSYGAGLYGFNFLDNTYSLWPATKRTVPLVEDLNLTVKNGRTTDLVRGIDSDNLTVYGPKPTDKTWRVQTSMNNPARVFATDLRRYLADKGIDVQQKSVSASNGQTLLLTHYSPEMSQILYEMMVESHNLYAEGMLRAIAPGSTRKQAIERETKIWSDRGIPTAGNKILDGSGLSRADRLQPIFVANVLEWMAKSRYASDYVSFFPLCGLDGTVKNLLKNTPLEGQLALKSGSMNAVQCFAGYKLDSESKPTHVVVIFVNAFYCDRSVLRKSIENFLLNIFK